MYKLHGFSISRQTKIYENNNCFPPIISENWQFIAHSCKTVVLFVSFFHSRSCFIVINYVM